MEIDPSIKIGYQAGTKALPGPTHTINLESDRNLFLSTTTSTILSHTIHKTDYFGTLITEITQVLLANNLETTSPNTVTTAIKKILLKKNIVPPLDERTLKFTSQLIATPGEPFNAAYGTALINQHVQMFDEKKKLLDDIAEIIKSGIKDGEQYEDINDAILNLLI